MDIATLRGRFFLSFDFLLSTFYSKSSIFLAYINIFLYLCTLFVN